MNIEKVDSKIIENYLSTTSASNEHLHQNLKVATLGLKRGLADWLNVKNKAVVDLGCGTGELCWLLKAEGATEVTGVNLSLEEIQFAQKTVSTQFVHADILVYLKDQKENSKDVIYAMNILEHLDKDTLYQVMVHAHKALKHNGELIAMVPNATSPFGTMTRYWDITHQLAFTPSSARQLQKLVGFKQAQFKEWGPRPHGVISTIRYALWQCIRIGIMIRLMIETGSAKEKIYTADMLMKFVK